MKYSGVGIKERIFDSILGLMKACLWKAAVGYPLKKGQGGGRADPVISSVTSLVKLETDVNEAFYMNLRSANFLSLFLLDLVISSHVLRVAGACKARQWACPRFVSVVCGRCALMCCITKTQT
jgi:hypothetical protein